MNINYQEVENLTIHALNNGEYQAADTFLNQMLYSENPEIAKQVLTEQNMVLKLLTEALLCEQNRGNGADSWDAHARDYRKFFTTYQRVKRAIRRIWFGLDKAHQREINALLSENPISSDLLAVITKYSVPRELWGDVFERLIFLLDERHREIKEDLRGYREGMLRSGLGGSQHCMRERKRIASFSYKKLDYSAKSFSAHETDPKKLAVIFCTNDTEYAAECRAYLDYLELPERMCGEILEIWGAPGMAAGYNFAMSQTDAKYKLFIHHDTMLLDTSLPRKLVDTFFEKERLGMLGIFGTTRLPESGRWAKTSYEDSVLTLWQDAILDFIPPKRVEEKEIVPAEAIDGAFLATAVDLPWREELFDGWHFYDISQCFEMRKAGFEIGLVADKVPWILHESTLRPDPEDAYSRYSAVFLENYKFFSKRG